MFACFGGNFMLNTEMETKKKVKGVKAVKHKMSS